MLLLSDYLQITIEKKLFLQYIDLGDNVQNIKLKLSEWLNHGVYWTFYWNWYLQERNLKL